MHPKKIFAKLDYYRVRMSVSEVVSVATTITGISILLKKKTKEKSSRSTKMTFVYPNGWRYVYPGLETGSPARRIYSFLITFCQI